MITVWCSVVWKSKFISYGKKSDKGTNETSAAGAPALLVQ